MTKQEKVINFIKKQIEEGKYKPGKRILSEEDLAYYLKVSRITVRGALNVLELENIVERRPRSGTYVKGNSRKHIIISTNEIFLLSEISGFQKQIINLLNTKIEENGFIPFLHMEKSKKKDRYGFTEDIDISNTLHRDNAKSLQTPYAPWIWLLESWVKLPPRCRSPSGFI